ncbi:MAG: D-glycerate dehydrogenase [Bdellovibrionales bacterium]|nr:D-glycerate dehydrogenase [Bdellovibrionales bacterium]
MKTSVMISKNIHQRAFDIFKEHNILTSVLKTKESLMDECQKHQALICMLSDTIDESFLKANSHLKAIANYAVGYNNIDLAYCKKLKIPVSNTPDVLTNATAELAFSLLLACSRHLKSALHNAELGQWKAWEPLGFLGRELHGQTLGVIGFGRIGQAFAKLCHQAFNMKVVYTAKTEKDFTWAQRVKHAELMQNSDIISLHCPLNQDTYKLLNKQSFQMMQKQPIVINTARGEVIDQEALVEALQENQIYAAGLDVTTPEPLPREHPLYLAPNVLITPHIGSATESARSAMAEICAKNIIAGLRGQALPQSLY